MSRPIARARQLLLAACAQNRRIERTLAGVGPMIPTVGTTLDQPSASRRGQDRGLLICAWTIRAPARGAVIQGLSIRVLSQDTRPLRRCFKEDLTRRCASQARRDTLAYPCLALPWWRLVAARPSVDCAGVSSGTSKTAVSYRALLQSRFLGLPGHLRVECALSLITLSAGG